MCCNFQKTARERWVESTGLHLMQPPRPDKGPHKRLAGLIVNRVWHWPCRDARGGPPRGALLIPDRCLVLGLGLRIGQSKDVIRHPAPERLVVCELLE